jgi:hypothetical protein
VTSLKGSARHLYETVYCLRGQMENLIKLHKAQLASDRIMEWSGRASAPLPAIDAEKGAQNKGARYVPET